MSARVFKPIPLAEVPRLRSPPALEGRLLFRGVQKVRRSLFHPDPEETKRFLQEEFAKLAASECDRWDFDFAKGRPRRLAGHYEWTPMPERPQPDALARPSKRCPDAAGAGDDLYPPIQSSSGGLAEDEEMPPADDGCGVEIPKKQRLITDFMQVRKRIDERAVKKPETPSRPLKKARMSLVDSAS